MGGEAGGLSIIFGWPRWAVPFGGICRHVQLALSRPHECLWNSQAMTINSPI